MTTTAPHCATSTAVLPDLSSDFDLNGQQIAAFQSDGHITLRGLCSGVEVDAYSPYIEAAMKRRISEKRALADRDAYGRAFLQTLNLRYDCDTVRAFVYARRFARVAARLLGVRAVRIFHEQALFKEAGGGPTPWHQDQYYWPLDTPNTIGLWMPLVPVTAENGALMHASRSHRNGMLAQHAISESSQDYFDRYITTHNLPRCSSAMAPGDATFHYGWTLHSAPANTSHAMRKAMVVTYYADGAKVIEPTNPSQENDRKHFLGDLKPGEFARSPMNPVLFSDPADSIV